METINKLPPPSILIVEDDEDDMMILKEGFDDLDYKLMRFYSNVLSAIQYLNATDDEDLPKLIVTDFNLPAVNGFQFVKFLKNHTRLCSIPIVVLTTSMSTSNRKLFFDEGVVKVIIKPNVFDEYKSVASILIDLADLPQSLDKLNPLL